MWGNILTHIGMHHTSCQAVDLLDPSSRHAIGAVKPSSHWSHQGCQAIELSMSSSCWSPCQAVGVVKPSMLLSLWNLESSSRQSCQAVEIVELLESSSCQAIGVVEPLSHQAIQLSSCPAIQPLSH
jgi:hypothetical protein